MTCSEHGRSSPLYKHPLVYLENRIPHYLEISTWKQGTPHHAVNKWLSLTERWRVSSGERYRPKPQKISRKYPWTNPGVFVNDSNREQWRQMILKKNPWLSAAVFGADSS